MLINILNDDDHQIIYEADLISFPHSWQVWSLESRNLVSSLQWESNITAFTVISGSHFMYVVEIIKLSIHFLFLL